MLALIVVLTPAVSGETYGSPFSEYKNFCIVPDCEHSDSDCS